MPTSMIRDRMIVYDSAVRRWYWGDDGMVLDEDVEAKHFSTRPPGMVWAGEDARPARGRKPAATAEEPADPPADPPPAE